MSRTCNYVGGCNREAARLFATEPVQGWLCEEHFHQALNAAAELEAAARQKSDAEWQTDLEEYLREHNMNFAELTEAQFQQIGDEAERWIHQKRGANKPKKINE